MPQIRKTHRKVKRVVNIKERSQYLRNYLKYKSYIPLCKKLKTNNNSLAKALSKEKQETKLLFSQNVALLEQIQDLGSACNKRNAVILNILKDAKEMLNTIVTMTIFLTNTISTCQEFTSSANINLRRSYSPAGRRDSYRRMSTKSPTKGVVKPMVSGHTITKPTINLSRVNMQDINNASNLSVIPEVVTPPRNQETNSLRPPVSITVRQRRYANGRPCGMPERVTVSSPRNSDENERRLSERRSRYSGRKSGKHSRSNSRSNARSLSGRNSTHNIGNLEYVGSPTVKLNDVSKFLQNSQSINIRLLTESRNDDLTINAENSVDMNQDDSQTGITVPETPPSDTPENANEQTVKNNDEQVDSESGTENEDKKENLKMLENSETNNDDPLEGPSWLFNNFQTVPCIINNEKTDNINVSIDNSSSSSSILMEKNDDSDEEKPTKELKLHLSEQESKWNSLSTSVEQEDTENENNSTVQGVTDNSVCNTFALSTPKITNQNEYKTDSKPAQNMANFVTQRRGFSLEEEDEDDFTLMYVRHPRDMHFDMNDLKFPVLEESVLKPVAPIEPEPEITTTLRKISQICPMPSISNSSIDETVFNHSTVNLPLLMNNDYDNKDLTPFKEKSDSTQRMTRARSVNLRDSNNLNDSATSFKKLDTQTNKRSKTRSKDPSTAKVVLQKLNESDVKSRTPSPESFNHQASLRGGNSSDSENSNVSVNSNHNLGRPQRKRAPTSFVEPSLRTKLRRK
ncbi:uncharacterized protein LOC144478379 [Augochlora pura]